MHIIIRVVLSAAALSMASTSIYGAIFDYSYEFGSGSKVAGSLEGDRNGDFVENIRNVTLHINGDKINGIIFTGKYELAAPGWRSGPVVSFDALQNNFLFANTDFLNNVYGGDGFYMVPIDVPPDVPHQARIYRGQYLEVRDEFTDARKWSLTAVPEPSTYFAGLSALGMLGLFGLKYRE